MYLKTDGDVVEDPDITRDELDMLVSHIPEITELLQSGDGKMLDLCCGQGRHSLQLALDYPQLQIFGHDQSSYLISLAKERALGQNVSDRTHFTVGDCREIPYPDGSFDLVLILGNSFGYFSSEDQDKAVLHEVQRVLRPGGRLVIDLTDGEYMRENFSERSWEWVDDTTFVCRERQLSSDGCRLFSREIITLTGKGVVRDQFYQERLYSKAQINYLMDSVGFQTADAPSTTLTANSKRNEDLGMMDHRVVVTSVKPGLSATAETVAVASDHTPVITVLLGDPSLPCVGKLNNTWNQEDLETRGRLLKALGDAGYATKTMKIVDRHDNLLTELVKNKPSFVFNLCDEGWQNDALKELHIPAILEMLGIPYSGAGPNCLAFCYDKGLVNRSAEAIGVATPKELTFLGSSYGPDEMLVQLEKLARNLSYPAFVKPIKGDNSLGITVRSIVYGFDELVAYIEELRSSNVFDVLVQEYLQGNEYGVGMIGNTEDGFTFLPTIQVNYRKILDKNLPPILGFESKWDPDSPYWTDIAYERAVDLAPEQEEALQNSCKILWERFSCRDYARFDFRSDSNGVIKLLEVNPNPGWCWDGKFAYMGKLAGLEYHDVLQLILKASWKRLRK
ncbi:hypothetical protein HDV03_004977 [Kappamyces sp. JEL0829]|nr:hypothetical protein HDV03_004977 [Kappamyces sp. JEL0829]